MSLLKEPHIADVSNGNLHEEPTKEVEYAPGEVPPGTGDTVETVDPVVVDKKETEVAPEYVPNKKFKVLDQEKEFDDFILPALNKETEAKFRELYEKAHGLDHVKPKLAEERQLRTQFEQQLGSVTREVQDILKFRDAGDLETFFAKVNLPIAKVAQFLLQYAEEQDRLKDLPPHMKKVYNEFGTLKQQNEQLAQQVEALHSGSVETAVQARAASLDGCITRPDLQPLVSEYDARLGKPGAFRDLVIRHGHAEFVASGGKTDLSPEEAVNGVLQMLGLKTQAASPAATPNGSAAPVASAPPATKVVTQAKPTVIPNVGNGTASPAMKRPRNLDELREMAKKAQAG